jgi:hypothetical protein
MTSSLSPRQSRGLPEPRRRDHRIRRSPPAYPSAGPSQLTLTWSGSIDRVPVVNASTQTRLHVAAGAAGVNRHGGVRRTCAVAERRRQMTSISEPSGGTSYAVWRAVWACVWVDMLVSWCNIDRGLAAPWGGGDGTLATGCMMGAWDELHRPWAHPAHHAENHLLIL